MEKLLSHLVSCAKVFNSKHRTNAITGDRGFVLTRPGDKHKNAQKRNREEFSGEVLRSRNAEQPSTILEGSSSVFLYQLIVVLKSLERSTQSISDTVLTGLDNSTAASLVKSFSHEDISILRDALEKISGFEVRHEGLAEKHIFQLLENNCDSNTQFAPTLANIMLNTSLWKPGQISLLDIECNLLGNDGIESLSIHVLPFLPGLQRLHLASNHIEFRGVSLLLQTLCSLSKPSAPRISPLQLEVLGLTNNKILDDTIQTASYHSNSSTLSPSLELGKILADFTLAYQHSIKRIHLNHTGLNTESVAALLMHMFSKCIDDLPSKVETLFPSYDALYLKQNKDMNWDNVLEKLAKFWPSGDRYSAVFMWAEKHVLC